MKKCPICNAWAFEDQNICYGCMHKFDDEPAERARVALCYDSIFNPVPGELDDEIDVFDRWERFLVHATHGNYDQAWIWECSGIAPINLAATVKSLKPGLRVVLIEDEPTGSLFSRAHTAGIDEVGEFTALCADLDGRAGDAPEKVWALPVHVYSNPETRACALGGITERNDELLVLCDEGPLHVDAHDERLLVMRSKAVGDSIYARLVPARDDEASRHTMMGGNYAGTSDSRFADMVEVLTGTRSHILPVHDRVEDHARG